MNIHRLAETVVHPKGYKGSLSIDFYLRRWAELSAVKVMESLSLSVAI